MIGFGSTVDPYNSYCSLTSYENDYIIIPRIDGWEYRSRKQNDKTTKN